MRENVYGIHQGRDHSEYTISVFRAIAGYIERFQQHGFW